MIVHLKSNTDRSDIQKLAEKYQAIVYSKNGITCLITSSGIKSLSNEDEKLADEVFVFDTDIQLASYNYTGKKREVKIAEQVIGGSTNNTIIIAGPCSIESEEQITQSAELLKRNGINTLRAGCYKPRTSPYTFQGMGLEGLKLLDKIRSKYGFKIITEVRDATHIEDVIEYADIVQIGAKAMYDHGILKRCGKINKPVLLKRGFGANLQEFVQAAEFILSGGNENLMLCERGIRTFENKTRFTLDLCGATYLKHKTNLPVILDPSHAMGYDYGVPDLSRACLALGIEGLLIETHPDPSKAMSDASQQLDHPTFEKLYQSLKNLAPALGVNIV